MTQETSISPDANHGANGAGIWILHLPHIYGQLCRWIFQLGFLFFSLRVWVFTPLGGMTYIWHSYIFISTITGWWLSHTSEKNKSQFGWLFPIYGKIKVMFQSPPASFPLSNHKVIKWSIEYSLNRIQPLKVSHGSTMAFSKKSPGLFPAFPNVSTFVSFFPMFQLSSNVPMSNICRTMWCCFLENIFEKDIPSGFSPKDSKGPFPIVSSRPRWSGLRL